MIKCSPFPKALEIQTASYCNGMCAICPYRDIKDSKSHGVMSKDLFKKIIDQIKNPWGIKIIPYLNNEPFLDPYFIDRLKYINKKCPEAEIEISTNLSMLNEEMQNKMLGINIRDLRMSIFGFTEKTHKKAMPGILWKNVKQNLDLLVSNKKLRNSIGQLSIVMIDYPRISQKDIEIAKKFCEKNCIKFELWGFLDRSNNVKKYKNNIYKKQTAGCQQNRPLDRIHITYSGKVILCCMDWKSDYILGDLNKQTIQRVWDSTKYRKIRKRIYLKNEKSIALCKKCKLAL
ncbi:MAG: SPASM domain-containing protein [Patescibacteria group bacterium]|nr:SPASM domain-containing protein [Patescibacteria group bacterium]